MLRQFSTKRVAAFFLLDWLGTLGVLLAADLIKTALSGTFKTAPDLWRPILTGKYLDLPVFAIVALLWPFFFIVFSVYDARHNETLKAELINLFLAVCVSTATLAGILYFTYRGTSRGLVLVFFALDAAALLGGRVVLWAYRRSSNGRRNGAHRRVLVVGAGPVGRNAVQQLRKYAWSDLELAGYLDDDLEKQGGAFDQLPVLGTLDQVENVVEAARIREAVVALPLQAHDRLVDVCRRLQKRGVRVHVIPDLFALSFPSAALEGFGGIPVIDLGQPGICGWQRVVKRAFDVLAVSAGLVFLAPLFLVIAAAIRLDSPGPVFYSQKRVGENGKPFLMLKFRSMKAGADPRLHQEHVARLIRLNLTPEQVTGEVNGSLKLENDPRVTPVGRFLRRTSLDELPQLFNVLRGEMSLVGPRPPLPYEVEVYKEWHKRRLETIPGITGLWQIKGRNTVSFDEMVRMDLEYIQSQSFWNDLAILVQTPLALITTRGAG